MLTRLGKAVAATCAILVWTGAADAGDRLILISIDGLRADVVTEADAPRISMLRAAGASAAEAFNDLPSATMQNHATMLTGLVSSRHGLLVDFELPGTIPHPTLFDFATAAGLRCAFFANKDKLRHLAPPAALETIDTDGNSTRLVDRVLEQITADGPDLMFVHLRDPDSVGHRDGWLSPSYFDAVVLSDENVGRIADAAAADDTRGTYIIVTADHGGDGLNHFINIPENRRIPWIVSGPGIPAGLVLTETVSIVDTTPTALWLLGGDVPPRLAGRVLTALLDGGKAKSLAPVAPVNVPCLILVLPVLGALLLAVWRSGDLMIWRLKVGSSTKSPNRQITKSPD